MIQDYRNSHAPASCTVFKFIRQSVLDSNLLCMQNSINNLLHILYAKSCLVLEPGRAPLFGIAVTLDSNNYCYCLNRELINL